MKPKKIERAAIYCRGENLAYQAGLSAAFIMDWELSYSRLYVDSSESRQDAWANLMRECARGYIDVIIVRDMDIFTESTEGLQVIGEALPIPILGAEDLYQTKDNLNPETLEYEKPKKQKKESQNYLSESLREVLRANGGYGHVVGLVPFGYLRENKKLVPDPITAPIIESIFVKAETGEKLTVIASCLEHGGIPSPSGSARWSDGTIRDMLRNDAYRGIIVNQELFDKVQERFKKKTIKQFRERGQYQGLVFCEVCKKAMAYQGVDERRKTAFYSCKFHTGTRPEQKPLAHMPKVNEEVLKSEVLRQCNEYIKHMLSDRDKLDSSVEKLKDKKELIEKKIENVGARFLKRGEFPNIKGLWTSWNEARGKYLASISYRSLMLHRYEVYQPTLMEEHDYDMERKLIRSITIDADGKVSVHFLGDFLFK